MMLDSENSNSDPESDNKENMICQYCQCHGRVHETGENVGNSPPIYWGIQLDQDLLETLISIYPEWFKGYNLNMDKMVDKTPSGAINLDEMQTSPKSQVDENSIQKSMDKNKESLKVKLMLRRPINQLVDQGIMPPPKTPPAYYEERRKLERAKMGDILKHKIQRRPDRQELIQQHILEDSNIDPSLQDRQRQLKKARLADDLNDKLSHRPGPLELVKGNILHVDDTLAEALKSGIINFKKTSEGEIRKHPPRIFVYDEDSNGSELSPQQSPQQGDSDQSQSTSVPSPPDCCIVPQISPDTKISSSPCSTQSSGSTPSPSPTETISLVTATISTHISKSPGNNCSSNNSKRSKKNKAKSQPKTRTIKFHEYKGPPNIQKNSILSHQSMPMESSYELLLQQQQLFLQWQLEWQHKYPQIILPATQKTDPLINSTSLTSNNVLTTVTPMDTGQMQQQTQQSTPPQQPTPPPPQPPRNLSKLEDMKVSDLKAELKKRNLPVSGSKPQLIERLKPYSDVSAINVTTNSGSPFDSTNNGSPNGLITTTNTLNNIKVDPSLIQNDEATNMSMNLGSPPMSPLPSDLNNSSPVSPENSLDQPFNLSQFKQSGSDFSSQGSIPGALQQNSRPPSVAPMDVDVSTTATSTSASTNTTTTTIATSGGFENMDIGDFLPLGFQITSQHSTLSHEDLVRQQQKKIEELQRELQRSQFQLQQQQMLVVQQQQQFMTPSITTATTSGQTTTTTTTDSKMLQKLQLQQHLHQKLQQQQLQQQQLQQQMQQQQLQQQVHKLQQQQLQLQPQQQLQSQQLQSQQHQSQQHQSQQHQSQQHQSLQHQTQQHQAHQHQAQQHQSLQHQTQQHQSLQHQTQQHQTQQQLQQQQLQQLQQQQLQQQQQQQQQQLQQQQQQEIKLQQQQHLQQQQQQLQQQKHLQQVQKLHQQTNIIPTSSNNKVKPNMLAYFQNQNINLSSSVPSQQTKVFTLSSAPTSTTQSFSFSPQNSRDKAIITALANGLAHSRSVSMPTSPVHKNTNTRLVSNSPVSFNKPPPDYNEATKQLKNKQLQQQTNLLINNIPPTQPSQTKSVKSQAVDDVLEILIKQGELPPSAAQEPPPTPKSTVSPNTLSSFTSVQSPLMSHNSPLPPDLLGNSSLLSSFIKSSNLSQTLSKESSPPPLLGGMSTASLTSTTDVLSVSLDQSPGGMDLSSLQLDLGLSDSNMNNLDLSPFSGGKCKDSDLLTVPSGSSSSLHNSEPNLASLDLHDGTQNMDIDVSDVSDWLDVIMPSTGLTPLSINAPMSLPDTDSDPMLSHNQDPLDFFSIDEIDFRTPTDLSALSWDKVDFAT